MKKKTVAILGYGNIAKSIIKSISSGLLSERYSLNYLWNRSMPKGEDQNLSKVRIAETIDEIIEHLDEISLVVECCHPVVLHRYAEKIAARTDLFISSPAAFSNYDFFEGFMKKNNSLHQVFIPLGATLAVGDIIRLDQLNALKNVTICMRKAPVSIRVEEKFSLIRERLSHAMDHNGDVLLTEGSVRDICAIAPQNTNVMSIYALAASQLGFDQCKAELVANRNLNDHIIELSIETKNNLRINTQRINPAATGAVTGTATFDSFLHSLYQLSGISHNGMVFC